MKTTTTMGHNAKGNGTIEVFWRFWNRCLRLLPDDHYARWPDFASRIAFAYNTAGHESIAGVALFAVYHGAPARSPLAIALLEEPDIDENRELCLPGEFAEAVAVSTRVFSQLIAANHDQFVRNETAARLNLKGTAKTFQVGEKVKVRVPPTASQLDETGATTSQAHNRVERPLHYRGATELDNVFRCGRCIPKDLRAVDRQPAAVQGPPGEGQCRGCIQPHL